MVKAGAPWTAEETERLYMGWEAGKSIPALARSLGRTVHAVAGRIARTRIDPTLPTCPPRLHPKPWTAGEIEQVQMAWQANETLGAIARALGRKSHSVYYCLQRIRRTGGLAQVPRRQRLWTPEETAFLRTACAAGMPVMRMAKHLDRTTSSVRSHLSEQGIKLPKTKDEARRGPQVWSPAEDERLRADETAGLSAGDCAIGLGRSMKEVRVRARVLGCGHRWTFEEFSADEDAHIRAVYTARLPLDELIADGRTIRAIQIRAHHLGLSQRRPPLPPAPGGQSQRLWTPEETAFLRTACAAGMPVMRMAKHLDRTTSSVRSHLSEQGIKLRRRTGAREPTGDPR